MSKAMDDIDWACYDASWGHYNYAYMTLRVISNVQHRQQKEIHCIGGWGVCGFICDFWIVPATIIFKIQTLEQ